MEISVIVSLMGGLGLFLLGMKQMSDGLEKAAGAKMRSILEAVTTNRLLGTLVGILFCAVIQSSSATTVMVVSFVNAGMMTLYQAAGVIMGANIGTTVTSQLVSFNLSAYAPVFLFIGVILTQFVKNDRVKKIGEVILGFGVLFMGLSVMSGSMSSLKDSPQVANLLGGLTNPFLGVVMGTIITAIIQSSSVTVSIVLLMAQQGLLELPICFYIILGCNIGACMSAMLASLSGKKDAKRAALIHLFFNIIGTVIIYLVLTVAGGLVLEIIMKISGGNPGRCVANAHTLFKICQVIVLLPFTTWIVKLTYLAVPGEETTGDSKYQLFYIGKTAMFSPTTAVIEAVMELEHMGTLAYENLNRGLNALIELDQAKIDKVYEVEKQINFMNHAITDYLVKIGQMTLPIDDSRSIGALFHVVNDIERIGDHAENLADSARNRIADNIAFSGAGLEELKAISEKVNTILQYSIDMFAHNTKHHMQDIIDLENEIDEMERQFQKNHVERLTKNECTAASGMLFSDAISGFERVADHATNIAYALLEEAPEEEED
ncbi:MAG: Na/Pi cotransporter family protein [Lachnospiraceae bacterium]|jgi:phosphate:Na+ symporter|nr:Na/Pi cotransporter family protein [Lachnospiraceae bacterium]